MTKFNAGISKAERIEWGEILDAQTFVEHYEEVLDRLERWEDKAKVSFKETSKQLIDNFWESESSPREGMEFMSANLEELKNILDKSVSLRKGIEQAITYIDSRAYDPPFYDYLPALIEDMKQELTEYANRVVYLAKALLD